MLSQSDVEKLFAELRLNRIGYYTLKVHTNADTLKDTYDRLLALKHGPMVEYDKVRALLKEEVWKYYEEVLGVDSEDFREVKMLRVVEVNIKQALRMCLGVRRVHATRKDANETRSGPSPVKETGGRPRGRPKGSSNRLKGPG